MPMPRQPAKWLASCAAALPSAAVVPAPPSREEERDNCLNPKLIDIPDIHSTITKLNNLPLKKH